MTIEAARETIKDPLYYGVMMVKKGEADGMVAVLSIPLQIL